MGTTIMNTVAMVEAEAWEEAASSRSTRQCVHATTATGGYMKAGWSTTHRMGCATSLLTGLWRCLPAHGNVFLGGCGLEQALSLWRYLPAHECPPCMPACLAAGLESAATDKRESSQLHASAAPHFTPLSFSAWLGLGVAAGGGASE